MFPILILIVFSIIGTIRASDSNVDKVTLPWRTTSTTEMDISTAPTSGPPMFQVCWNCTSLNTPSCVNETGPWDVEFCEHGNDICAVWIQGVWTFRGCFKQWSYPHTKVCGSTKCNSMIYPENRKTCYQCMGPMCVDLRLGHDPKPCSYFVEDDNCYTLILDKDNAYRGCMSDVSIGRQLCISNPDLCLVGDTNGQKLTQCVECQSGGDYPDDLTCYNKTDTTLCPYSPHEKHNRCFTLSDGESLIRGCLIRNELQCMAQLFNGCTICSGAGCNSQSYYGLTCKKCSSDRDPSCADKEEVKDLIQCVSTREEVLSCFRDERVIGDAIIVSRGCWHTIKDETRRENCKLTHKECKTCSTPACNVKLNFQKCYTCNSLLNPACADLSKHLPEKECIGYMDTCQAYVQDGITYRDCLPASAICHGDCIECRDSLCNHTPVPDDRLRCYLCRGRVRECTSDLSRTNRTLRYCQYHDPDDRCFMHYTDGIMTRGCRSDQPAICNNVNCVYCATDACNSRGLISEPTLKCIKCKDASCEWGFRETTATDCTALVPYNVEETCYTKNYRNGFTERGCSNDADDCSIDDYEFCYKCKGDGCNNQNVANRSCLTCDSLTKAACALDKPKIEPKKCEKKLIPHEESGCFTLSLEGFVIRGCLTDMPESLQTHCREMQGKTCDVCFDNGCNRNGPSSAGTVGSSLKIISVLVYILLQFN